MSETPRQFKPRITPQKPGEETREEILLGYPLSALTDDIANAALLYLGQNMDQLEKVLLTEPILRDRRLPIAKSVDMLYAKLAESLNLQLDIFEEKVEKLVVRVPPMVKTSTLKERIAELTGEIPYGSSLTSELNAAGGDTNDVSMAEGHGIWTPEDELARLRTEEVELDQELAQLRGECLHLSVYRQALESVKAGVDADVAQLTELEQVPAARALFCDDKVPSTTAEKEKDARKHPAARGPQRPLLGLTGQDGTPAGDAPYDALLLPAVQASNEMLKATDLLKQVATAHPAIGSEVEAETANPENQAFALDLSALLPPAPSPVGKAASAGAESDHDDSLSSGATVEGPDGRIGPNATDMFGLAGSAVANDVGVISNPNFRQDMRAFLNLFSRGSRSGDVPRKPQ